MEDERMIAAARRAARRLARRTGTPYQTCLDIVARDCGRRHWADYVGSPTAIPREEDRRVDAVESSRDAMLRAIGKPVETREVWSLGDGELPEGWPPGMFLPRFNALSANIVPPDRETRRLYVDTLAEALLPRGLRSEYFDDTGRKTLSGFMLFTVESMGDRASIPAMIDMINHGLATAADSVNAAREHAARQGRLGPIPDYLAFWLGAIDAETRRNGYDEGILDAIVPLVSMGHGERSAIFGTMDKALLAFKSHAVRRRTDV